MQNDDLNKITVAYSSTKKGVLAGFPPPGWPIHCVLLAPTVAAWRRPGLFCFFTVCGLDRQAACFHHPGTHLKRVVNGRELGPIIIIIIIWRWNTKAVTFAKIFEF